MNMNYLVTGGKGKLGTELRPLIRHIAPAHQELDILDPVAVRGWVGRNDIDAVLHLAAVTARATAEQNKEHTYAVNVIGTRNLAQAAGALGKKMIYVSTEIVFPGSHGNYKETDTPNPRDWYAATKYAGELELKTSGAPHLIIRTTFRPKVWDFPTAYANVHTTSDYVDVIAQEIALCLSINPDGVLHLGTPVKTAYELALRRNPNVQPEDFSDPTFLRRDLNIDRWLELKQRHG